MALIREDDLLVAREGASWDFEGTPVFIVPGDVAHRDSPVIQGHEQIFMPLLVKFPPRAKSDAPANPNRADQREARTR